ncbi:MAG: hypothetical protein AVDCRST_MAG89-1652, partial [uncultured Gemmatimonadetes bacterium]
EAQAEAGPDGPAGCVLRRGRGAGARGNGAGTRVGRRGHAQVHGRHVLLVVRAHLL